MTEIFTWHHDPNNVEVCTCRHLRMFHGGTDSTGACDGIIVPKDEDLGWEQGNMHPNGYPCPCTRYEADEL